MLNRVMLNRVMLKDPPAPRVERNFGPRRGSEDRQAGGA
jgi:hypothetical protein